MGTALPLQHNRSLATTIANRYRPRPQSPLQKNVSQPMRDLTLKRIATAANRFRSSINQSKQLCSSANSLAATSHSNRLEIMADKAIENNSPSISAESTIKVEQGEKKDLEKSKLQDIPPPPPPEKPLPDDCCGSGCVRCVWDVYYDELEAYNKLYKTNPDSNSYSSRPS